MESPVDPEQRALYEVLSGAVARLDAGQLDEALKVLQSQGGFALNNPVGRNILGEIELQRGSPAEALNAFNAAIKLAPHFAEAHANRGAALIDLGRLKEALEAEQTALRFNPGLATAHFNRGVVLAALKRREEAIEAFGAAIRERPDHAEALLNRGAAILEAGRPRDALADFSRAQQANPALAGLQLAVAQAQRALGEKEQALAAAERALRLDPTDAKALVFKATVLVAMDRFADALPVAEGLVRRSPADPEARLLLFKALRGRGRFDDALASADDAIRIAPGRGEGHAMRALALTDLGRSEEAMDAFLLAVRGGASGEVLDQARALLMQGLERPEILASDLPTAEAMVARSPGNAAAYLFRHRLLSDLGRHALALEDAEAAVRLAPAKPEGYVAEAGALDNLGRTDEARQALKTAERLGASKANYHHVLAGVLMHAGDFVAARAAFERALALDPDDATYHHHYGMFLLSLGETQAGWREHEWHVKRGVFTETMVSDTPTWRGEDLTGRRVLVRHEQGMGDIIQFARFVPELAARTAALAFIAPPALLTLLQRSLPSIEVVNAVQPRIPFDFQIAQMSLPLALKRTTTDAIAMPIPYVVADAARVAKWREPIGRGGFKVGIVWQGSPRNRNDAFRSVPLRTFATIAGIAGVRLVSLQAQHGLDQLAALPAGMLVERYGDDVERNPAGLEEIAAIMPSLDLVIASDTAIAHLAGAMGRPTWRALSNRPDWRWMEGRSDTLWYPTMRLFRTGRDGDWGRMFADMARELGRLVQTSGALPR